MSSSTTVPHENTETTSSPVDGTTVVVGNEKSKEETKKLTKAERRAVHEAQHGAAKNKEAGRALQVPSKEVGGEEGAGNLPTTTTTTTTTTTIQDQVQYVDYLCILDFEATCNEGGNISLEKLSNKERCIPEPQEIIEFPTLLLNIATRQIESTFHYYILPDVSPILSEFCTELTGITQDMVQDNSGGGIGLQEAIQRHQTWLVDENNLISFASLSPDGKDEAADGRARFLYATCGDWDLKTCLPEQLKYHGETTPHGFGAWINVKKPYYEVCQISKKKRTGVGMVDMLSQLGLELEGRHHSGIDDCKNIARICIKLLEKGWIPKVTTTTTKTTS